MSCVIPPCRTVSGPHLHEARRSANGEDSLCLRLAVLSLFSAKHLESGWSVAGVQREPHGALTKSSCSLSAGQTHRNRLHRNYLRALNALESVYSTRSGGSNSVEAPKGKHALPSTLFRLSCGQSPDVKNLARVRSSLSLYGCVLSWMDPTLEAASTQVHSPSQPTKSGCSLSAEHASDSHQPSSKHQQSARDTVDAQKAKLGI